MKHDANTLFTILADLLDFALEDYSPSSASLDYRKAVEAAKNAVAGAPVECLSGTVPLVLFFPKEADRKEFIEAIQAAKPGMRTLAV